MANTKTEPKTGNEAAAAIAATAAPAVAPRPESLDTPEAVQSFISARVAYLERHPTARKDRINSSVAKGLNARKVTPPPGMPFWTGIDVQLYRAKHGC